MNSEAQITYWRFTTSGQVATIANGRRQRAAGDVVAPGEAHPRKAATFGWTDCWPTFCVSKGISMQLKEFDRVCVIKLLTTFREVTSSYPDPPQPALGDAGIVVQIDGDRCLVEKVDATGYTRWLADFAMAEVERIESG
jgi:hypothetical protein